METSRIMKQFMEPQSVALIGVSRHTGEEARNILENILSYGYKGRLYPVNPNATEILGIKAYPSIAQIEGEIDLAVISTPRSAVPRLVNECADSGVTAVVVVAQGFSDATDDEGKRLQKEMNDIVGAKHVRILGPNTLGTGNAFINFSSSFTKLKMKRHPVGIICQTGIFFVGFPDIAFVGKGIDLGNACDISFNEGLQYFDTDPDVRVVALHIEGMHDPKSFMDIAKRVASKKPVLALKTGKSEQAARAAQSHTGSLTGSAEVWHAALKQAGIIQVADLQELIDLTRAFSILPFMQKSRIAVATSSGGLGIMAIDACQYSGLEIGKLSPNTEELLSSMAPSWLNIGNPLDIWPIMVTSSSPTKPLRDGLEILLSDKDTGAVVFIGAAFDRRRGTSFCKLLNDLAAEHPDKPVVTCIFGPYGDEVIAELQDGGRVIGFPTPERAIRALARLDEYSRSRRWL